MRKAKRVMVEPGSARAAAIAARTAQMPVSCRGTYRRAVEGRSLRAAVKAFCLECVGWKREEVAACTALACPLWPVRPFQRSETLNDGPSLTPEATIPGADGPEAGR